MGRIVYIFSFLTLSFVLNSCFSSSEEDSFDKLDRVVAPVQSVVKYNVIKIESLYSMKVPAYMILTDQLREEASLQYVNPFKEKYVIVLDEKIEDVMAFMEDYGVYDESKSKLDNYVTIRSGYFKESGNVIKNQTPLRNEMINGLKTISTVIDANVPGVNEDVTYYFTFIEGEDHYYMISSWTLFERKKLFSEEVEAMTNSFKEL